MIKNQTPPLGVAIEYFYFSGQKNFGFLWLNQFPLKHLVSENYWKQIFINLIAKVRNRKCHVMAKITPMTRIIVLVEIFYTGRF